MEYAEADNMEKYRKYIQKRRISPDPPAEEITEPKEIESIPLELPKMEISKGYGGYSESSFLKSSIERETPSFRSGDPFVSPHFKSSIDRTHSARPASSLRRTDPNLYRTLYNNRKTQSHTGSYASAYSSSYASGRTDVEDNHATVLAIKLIKQSLACFAILGIIVLLQGRSDMAEVLATIKRQVLEIHIEPQGIYEGIQGFIAQATQFLGGITLIGTIVACILAILIHECFHVIFARLFHMALYFVRPTAIGLKARLKGKVKSFKKLVMIYFGGPLGNFVTAAIFAGSQGFGENLFEANLAIGLFNLFPIYPLDGGQIFLIVIYKLVGSNRAFKVLKKVSLWVKISLYGLGLVQIILFTNPSLIIAAVMLPGTRLLEETMRIMKLENLMNRKQRIKNRRIYSARHLVVLEDSNLGDIIQKLDYDRFHILYVLNSNLEIIGQITEQQVIKALQTCSSTDRVCDVFFFDN